VRTLRTPTTSPTAPSHLSSVLQAAAFLALPSSRFLAHCWSLPAIAVCPTTVAAFVNQAPHLAATLSCFTCLHRHPLDTSLLPCSVAAPSQPTTPDRSLPPPSDYCPHGILKDGGLRCNAA
jgi:hypothetical protein